MQISDRKKIASSRQGNQRNISMDMKTGLKELEKAVDVIAHCRANWLKMKEKTQKLATGKGNTELLTMLPAAQYL